MDYTVTVKAKSMVTEFVVKNLNGMWQRTHAHTGNM